MNTSDYSASINRNSPKHDFPHHQTPNNNNNSADFHYYHSQQHQQFPQQYPPSPGGHAGGQQQQQQQQDLTIDGIPNNFPHRRSRASRTFKNPPQPHMCIKEKTIDGKEVFINVLSWTRIANPDNPDAPIPLYGGMKVGKIPPGVLRTPPLVYAVMASPEVLKKAGRKCPDTPERMNLVDLMCEFVEAMNPTLHLSRKPEILKDRDLSGELKDVWSAVQACRDKGRIDNGPPENLVVYTEFGPETAPSYEQSQQQSQYHHQLQNAAESYQLHLQQQHQSPSHEHSSCKQKHQQSAITNSATSNNNSIEGNAEKNALDAPDCAHNSKDGVSVNKSQPQAHSEQLNNGIASSCSVTNSIVDELLKTTEMLNLSSNREKISKSNGLTLPTGGSTSTSAENASSSSTISESNSVPVASQETSPSSPTAAPAVSPTAAAAAVTPPPPQKESKNSSSHNFFPMFRSSKSSNSEKSNEKDKEKDTSSESTAPDTPVKTASKKSGLNFFRRNKSDSKKEQPSTPTKQQQQPPQTTSENNKLNLLVEESLLHHHHHHHHHHHLVDGSNGTGEIIENSATIVAK